MSLRYLLIATLVFSLVGAAFGVGVCAGTSGITLAKDGKTNYVITADTRAGSPEMHAAEELAELLEQATGARFNIVNPFDAAGKPQIVVGALAAMRADRDLSLAGLGDDGIIVKSSAPNIILTGGLSAPRGTLYAVYTFLEDYVGYRWWTATETTVPNRPVLRVKNNINIRHVPVLERRETYYYETFDADFAVRSKNNGFAGLDKKRGGSLTFAGPMAHSFERLVPASKYFQSHPEWFSEIKGVRTGNRSQLCLTNPELLEFVIEGAKRYLRDNPNAKFVSITQNDWANYCTCDKCKAIDEAEGSPSGTMIRFVNAVAEEIEKEFPNVLVDTFAYQYTRKAPKLTKPRDNVAVRLCSIECNFGKPLTDKSNEAFRRDIEDWSKITNNLYVWDYVTNFSAYIQAHPNLRVIGPNIRFFVNNNVKGIFEQGAYQSLGSEMGPLRNWVLLKLLWDPTLNEKALIKEFLDGYYGSAGKYIQMNLDLIHDTLDKSDFYMRTFVNEKAPYVASDIVDQSARYFEQARAAVIAEGTYLRRVEIAQLSAIYSRIKLMQQAPLSGEDLLAFTALVSKFARIAASANITRVSEGTELPGWANRAISDAMTTGQKQQIIDVQTKRGPVKAIKMATTWVFTTDKTDEGEAKGWFKPGFDDSKWTPIRTDVEAGWHSQGYPDYIGFGWYRQKFDLPQDVMRKHMYIFFKAIDEEAWVYVNSDSELSYEHSCKSTGLVPDVIWLTPFMFDAGKFLKSGSPNLISVKVFNVAGDGGVYQPVYIIASDNELTMDEVSYAVAELNKKSKE